MTNRIKPNNIAADGSHDPEMAQFERDLLESIQQAKRGEYARVHTPEMIRARGRPIGTTKANAKVHTSMRLSPEVVNYFKATGKGWQTRVDAVLGEWIATNSLPNHR